MQFALRLFCSLLLGLAGAGSASAGAFHVNPVRVTLSAERSVAALTVRNTGSEPTVVQLEPVGWSQQGQDDVYAPTQELLATPPVFSIPPGGSQVVRVGLRRAPDPRMELSYRLFLHEVPPAAQTGVSGLQVALRIGIPVFVAPTAPVRPALDWRLVKTAEGGIELSLENPGSSHVQVQRLTLATGAAAPAIASVQTPAYVLAGKRREWKLPAPPSGQAPAVGARVKLFATTDAGSFESDVVVEP